MRSASSKKQNEYVKLSLTLLGITFIVALLLAFVNYITAPKIVESNNQKLAQAMSNVLPEATQFEDLTSKLTETDKGSTISAIQAGKNKRGEIVGYCVQVSPKGYSAEIEMMVGIDKDGKVVDTDVISISDTPGIGTQVEEPAFREQFVGIDTVVSVKGEASNPNEVALISGATYSSSGFAEGVSSALQAVQMIEKGA